MSRKIGAKLAGLAVAAAFGAALLAPAAQATPINTNPNPNAINVYNGSTLEFSVGCGSANGSCSGLLEALNNTASPYQWSSSTGQMQGTSGNLSNANPANEMAFVNGVLGTSYTTPNNASNQGGNISPSGNGDSAQFTTNAASFLIKIGNAGGGYALLQNISHSDVDVWFTAIGKGGGISHYISFGAVEPVGTGTGNAGGPPTPVPEPGVLGMFGLGLLALGIGYGLRRRRVA